ncbi:hypothetical protein Mal52_51230 [Symmachiella dynata]|uniref:Uncharacterized protein n=1 Tax=Symmachiella dynata TaxID=2527995 RepID=A0A517ZVX3_9PLAN|nr:hypothetical protein [Symmachiella dynata]QDU46601.1 hypothetical protein Mal52_51230 [Symmachiella dynata]
MKTITRETPARSLIRGKTSNYEITPHSPDATTVSFDMKTGRIVVGRCTIVVPNKYIDDAKTHQPCMHGFNERCHQELLILLDDDPSDWREMIVAARP